MLNIYNYKPDDIEDYDLVFETKIVPALKVDTKSTLWDTLCRVEDVKQAGTRILSKFNDEPVSLYDISNGLQILLCIMKYPDKVFDTLECGDNIYDEIYALQEGSVYMSNGLMPYYGNIDVLVVSRHGSKLCHNYQEAFEYYVETN